jgi:hypothetical protein
MTRTVKFENGRFIVSDDPEHVIGTALAIITNEQNRPRIAERLAPDGDGFTIDTVGTVTRIETRDEIPEPWDEDPTLDPDNIELWALFRDRGREPPYYRRSFVIAGDELRELVAQALKQRDDALKLKP